jgi:hypothetical protein
MTKKQTPTTMKLRQLLKQWSKNNTPKIKPGQTKVGKQDYKALIKHLDQSWLNVKDYFYQESRSDYREYYSRLKQVREELTDKKALILGLAGVRLHRLNELYKDCTQLEDLTGGNLSTWEYDKFWLGLINIMRDHLYKPNETHDQLITKINRWWSKNWDHSPRHLSLPYKGTLTWDHVCIIVDDAISQMEADLCSPITLDRVEASLEKVNKVLDKYHNRS